MGAGAVVANRAADRGAASAGRIRAEHQTVRPQRGVEMVQHDARLAAHPARLGIDLNDPIEVFAGVDNHGPAYRLPGQAGAGAARQDGHTLLRADRHGGNQFLDSARNDHADGLHLVDAGVGAVQDAMGVIEAHVADPSAVQIVDEADHGKRLRACSSSMAAEVKR